MGTQQNVHVFNSSAEASIRSYYSPTRFPKLIITRQKGVTAYEIHVNCISVEDEEKQILHHLLTKTREHL